MSLTISDTKTKLRMAIPGGGTEEVTAKPFFQSAYEECRMQEPYAVSAMKETGIYKAVWDPEFVAWYQPWMNPHIDLETVCTGDRRNLCHAHADGRLQKLSYREIEESGIRDAGETDPTKAWSYAAFREVYRPEQNPDVNLMTLRVSNAKTMIKLDIPDGGTEEITAKAFFLRSYKESVLTESYVTQIVRLIQQKIPCSKTIDALALDETISIYVPPEEDMEKLKACHPDSEFKFRCPFCYNVFKLPVKAILKVSPKCPYCADSGVSGVYKEDMIEGAYLVGERRGMNAQYS